MTTRKLLRFACMHVNKNCIILLKRLTKLDICREKLRKVFIAEQKRTFVIIFLETNAHIF